MVVSRLHLFPVSLERKRAAKAANVAEMTVLIMERAMASPSPAAEMLAWEPPLKAKKPKNRINPPRAAS